LTLIALKAAITPHTKALLPVDAFGQPVDIEAIRSIAAKYGLAIIEDACEALGAELMVLRRFSGGHCCLCFLPK